MTMEGMRLGFRGTGCSGNWDFSGATVWFFRQAPFIFLLSDPRVGGEKKFKYKITKCW